MNKAAQKILLLLFTVILLTACQTTPYKPVVVNKGDNSLNQKIAASAAPKQKYNAPENYSDSFTSKAGNLQVSITAKITVPDVTAYPVVSVVPDDISQTEADLFINTFMQGKTLYKPKTDDDLTKSEIEEKIIGLKKDENEMESSKKSDPEGYADVVNEDDKQIAALKEKEKTAPDSYTPQIAAGKFEAAKVSPDQVSVPEGGNSKSLSDYLKSFQTIDVFADLGKKKLSELYITKNTSNKADRTIFDDYEEIQEDTLIKENNADLPGMKNTLKQALDIANNTLSSLGLKSMQPAFLGSAAYANKDYNRPLDQSQKFYFFIYTRNVQGLPTIYTDNNDQNINTQYNEPWNSEWVKITVGDSGLQSFAWQSPEKITGTLSENVALLPFQDIMDRFKKQIQISGDWEDDSTIINRKLNIDKITLGMGRVEKKDNPGVYMLVPEWDFFGSCVEKYADSVKDPNLDSNNECTDNTAGYSYLTINAIDGSVIDRSKGY